MDFIGAIGIVDAYLHPALLDMRDGVRLTVKRDFIDRFERTTGAKLGEYEYNRQLLHRWLQSRLNGYEHLPRVIQGVKFTDGIQADETETRAAA